MKKKVFNRVLAVALVLLGAWVVWNWFEFGKVVTRWQALENICSGRAVAQGRQDLLELNDRAGVLEALREKLAEPGDSIRCKKNYLQTLTPQYFNQPRTIERALESEQEATRRAAASLRYGDPELKERCAEIALAWLQDPGADSRHDAVLICRHLRLEAAVPTLLGFLDVVPETADELQLLEHSLAALRDFKPTGLSEKLLGLIGNESLDERVRGAALETLGRLDDAPREKVQELAIRMLSNRGETTFLRGKAINALRGKAYANDATWNALEATILDEEETNGVIQRMSLNVLGTAGALDRLEKLLYDRRVYRNPYFGFRIDVAAALAALNLRDRVAFDILCEYLVDDDPADSVFKVRQEAWLSLWTLAGKTYGRFYGLPQPEIFDRAPKPLREREMARHHLWRTETTRPGVSKEQISVLKQMTPDLKLMKRIREEFEKRKAEIFDQWEQEKKAAEEQTGPGAVKEPPVEPQGPPPPKDEGEDAEGKDDDGNAKDDDGNAKDDDGNAKGDDGNG